MAAGKKGGKAKKILKILLILFLLLLLIVGGFALGIYLQIFDTKEANEKLGLYNLPVIGEYFVKPEPATEEEMQEKPVEDVKPSTDKEKKESKPVRLTKAEIEKQMKEREAAERKRVSKLARLYTQMKPKDAAEALAALNDDMVISILQRMDEGTAAKIMTEFDTDRTARITRIMYEGKRNTVTTASDLEEQAEQSSEQ